MFLLKFTNFQAAKIQTTVFDVFSNALEGIPHEKMRELFKVSKCHVNCQFLLKCEPWRGGVARARSALY